MEIQIQYYIIFTFLCLLIAIHKLVFKKSIKTLPPGPRKLPLIGNLHQIGKLPHRSLRELAKTYGPLVHLQLGQISYITVSSNELAKEVMKTHDTIFASRPKLYVGDILLYDSIDIALAPYGNSWRQLRKICTMELLSIKRVRTYRKIREEEIFATVKYISENEVGHQMNLVDQLYRLTNTIVSRSTFGGKGKNVDEIRSTIGYVAKLLSSLSIVDLYPSLAFFRVINGTKAEVAKVRKEFDVMLNAIINDHIEKMANQSEQEEEDFVDFLLKSQKENDLKIPITVDNIKAVILDMFLAGTETAAMTMEWAMAEVVKHPRVMKKAQEEVRRVYGNKGYVDESELHQLTYISAIIRETLRLHPPLPLLLPRQTLEACELNGYIIPSKTNVLVNVWAIARDPKYWDEPEVFRPERFIDSSIDYRGGSFEYIPFGAGRRICPGISFASPILELGIANLLYHFDWKLPNGEKNEDLDMTETYVSVVRRKHDLCLVPITYQP